MSDDAARNDTTMPPNGATPPVGAVLAPHRLLARLAILALRPLPRAPLQLALAFAARTLAARHPDLFDRLKALGPAVILIDPADLPFRFAFRPGAASDRLLLIERDALIAADATIRGPLPALLALLQGDCDGDALFFSRDISIAGDTGCVLALRNAIDNAEIDLAADLAAGCGVAAGLVERLIAAPLRLAADARRRLDALDGTLHRPGIRS